MAKRLTVEEVNAAIARWQSRLRRAVKAIEKLEARRKRIEKAAAKPPKAKPVAETAPAPAASPPDLAVAHPLDRPVNREIDTSIPKFLQRKKLEPAAAQIVAEQAEAKKQKAAGKKARQKAERTGETRRMPLTGKAALAAIRNA